MAEGTHYAKLDEALRVLQDDALEFKRVSLAAQAVSEQRLSHMESTMKNVEALLHMEIKIPTFDASLHMVSVAYSWYKWMRQNNLLKSWQGFVDELLALGYDWVSHYNSLVLRYGSESLQSIECIMWCLQDRVDNLDKDYDYEEVPEPHKNGVECAQAPGYAAALGVGGNLDCRVGNRQCNTEMLRLPGRLLCIMAFGVEARDSAGSSPKHIVVYPRMCFLDLLRWHLTCM
ncbi:uncharacterized protein G2W53_021905 [Senna tora]|uniref:Uncharacterized protein n=1 Tax=Senna tora TaxID=362788 RepID=A0A834WLI8_9FABA|nr:uncharacterized protein G2W53_021905 [Senna tora]